MTSNMQFLICDVQNLHCKQCRCIGHCHPHQELWYMARAESVHNWVAKPLVLPHCPLQPLHVISYTIFNAYNLFIFKKKSYLGQITFGVSTITLYISLMMPIKLNKKKHYYLQFAITNHKESLNERESSITHK